VASESEKVVERLVAWIWERQALVGPLPGDDGADYQVVFRGRSWGERGPDFQGAIVARGDGTLLRGDVEVHVRTSDWRRHGHGRDPAYNRTVCHVVLWHDSERPTCRQDGVAVPTVELVTRLAAPLAELERRRQAEEGARPPEPACFAPPVGVATDRRLPAESAPTRPGARAPGAAHASAPSLAASSGQELQALQGLLERAGLERFQAKAAHFEGELACLPPAEVLYRGALRAMGYTANTAGFERLAEALPFDALRTLAGTDGAGRPLRVQAALLGAAGLLPGQRGIVADDGWPRALERAWDGFDGVRAEPLPASAWRWWRVRPENLPPRRAAGLGQVLVAWLERDPIGVLLDDLAEAERREKPARLAGRWRTRASDPFWPTHYDFGRASPGARPWLIGGGRAGEVAVNVLLPFLHALGQAADDPALSERALALYRRYPATAPNRVTVEMARQLGGPDGAKAARTACRQQGLIHLYRHWCDARDCDRCPAGASRRPLPPDPV
jgi:hypothetical protein